MRLIQLLSKTSLNIQLICLFVFVVCLVLFSLVAAAFLANKDVYINKKIQGGPKKTGLFLNVNNYLCA